MKGKNTDLTSIQLEALLKVSKTINSSLDPDTVLEKIITLTSNLLNTEAGSLLLTDEPSGMLIFKTAVGSKAQEIKQFTLKLGEGIAGRTAKEGTPIIVNDVSREPNFKKEIPQAIDFPTRSILSVPLPLHGKTIGVIEAINKKGGGFTGADAKLALGIAEQAAMALENARLHKALSEKYHRLEKELKIAPEFIGGRSLHTRNLLNLIKKVSPVDSTLLIEGETGTGKELVARMIHKNSTRKDFPFVCVTCAILTETLLESELFGHEKGAFTGATVKKTGKFEAAHRGTVFLDEISAIPLSTQTKLLRVLQEREFERVGGTETIRVDIRVIAATNENLKDLISAGKFREDLYYRLKVIEIPVMPLRERKEDIPLLAKYYLKQYSRDIGRTAVSVSHDAMDLLCRYKWPGNIRELKNVIERAVVLGQGDTLAPEHLPAEITQGEKDNAKEIPHDMTLASFEKHYISRVLKECMGNKSRAAKILGISRNRLDRKLE